MSDIFKEYGNLDFEIKRKDGDTVYYGRFTLEELYQAFKERYDRESGKLPKNIKYGPIPDIKDIIIPSLDEISGD